MCMLKRIFLRAITLVDCIARVPILLANKNPNAYIKGRSRLPAILQLKRAYLLSTTIIGRNIKEILTDYCPETKNALNFHEVSKPNKWSYPKRAI